MDAINHILGNVLDKVYPLLGWLLKVVKTLGLG